MQLLAGLVVNHFSYSAFMPSKLSMVVKNTLTLTTFSSDELEAARMAFRLLMHAAVFSPMLPSTRSPEAVTGIWPETNIRPGVVIAWEYGPAGGKASAVKTGLIPDILKVVLDKLR